MTRSINLFIIVRQTWAYSSEYLIWKCQRERLTWIKTRQDLEIAKPYWTADVVLFEFYNES